MAERCGECIACINAWAVAIESSAWAEGRAKARTAAAVARVDAVHSTHNGRVRPVERQPAAVIVDSMG